VSTQYNKFPSHIASDKCSFIKKVFAAKTQWTKMQSTIICIREFAKVIYSVFQA